MAVSAIFWTTVNAFDTPSDERVLQAPNGASRDRHQCVLAGHLARGLSKRRVWIGAGCSGDLPPPSPPAEKTTARQDQAGQAGTGDWAALAFSTPTGATLRLHASS